MTSVFVNTLRPRQNGRHFPDDIFKCIFFNENISISIQISLKFVPKGPINNIPALVQISWLVADQSTSHYLSQWWFVYWRIFASLGLTELIWPLYWHYISHFLPRFGGNTNHSHAQHSYLDFCLMNFSHTNNKWISVSCAICLNLSYYTLFIIVQY